MPTPKPKQKRQLVAEQWNEFSRMVVPPNASEVQHKQMKRAFYAGAYTILLSVVHPLSPDSKPTSEDIYLIEDVQQELLDFERKVKEGLA